MGILGSCGPVECDPQHIFGEGGPCLRCATPPFLPFYGADAHAEARGIICNYLQFYGNMLYIVASRIMPAEGLAMAFAVFPRSPQEI